MGSLTNFADLQTSMQEGTRSDVFMCYNGNVGLTVGGWLSSYGRYHIGAVIPSTPVAVTSATPGVVVTVPTTNTKQLWLVETEFSGFCSGVPNVRFNAVLHDRLSHQSGLSTTVTTEQTTNFPTAALTRYTTGEGVIPFLEVYGMMGTVNTTATIKYTNQAGVSGKISQPIAIVTGVNNGSDCITPFMLADGDTGCRSVESFTMAGAAASNVNVGITLMKKLCTMPPDTGSYVERHAYRQMMFHGGIVEILPGAFLQFNWYPSSSATGNWNMSGRIGIVEA